MDTGKMQSAVLAITEDKSLSVSDVINAIKELGNEAVEQCDPQIILQASSISQLPVDSSSIDVVLSSSIEFPGDEEFEEMSRVLRPGGTILIHKKLTSDNADVDKAISALERKLLSAGFLEVQRVQLKVVVPTEIVSFGVKGKKPSWDIRSSAFKKSLESLLELQVDDDSDLIDEDSLLTEEDWQKPQIPHVEESSCLNCCCGRAEAEEKAEKLGQTIDQLNKPQSACEKCGLGDAFRCCKCPYLGLPRFKQDDKESSPSGNFRGTYI